MDFFLFSENLEVIMPPSASKVIVQFSVKSVFDCFQNVNENFKKKSRKHPLEKGEKRVKCSKGCYLAPFQFPCESRCYDAAAPG